MNCLTMLCTDTAEIRKAKWNKMNEKCTLNIYCRNLIRMKNQHHFLFHSKNTLFTI